MGGWRKDVPTRKDSPISVRATKGSCAPIRMRRWESLSRTAGSEANIWGRVSRRQRRARPGGTRWVGGWVGRWMRELAIK